jgi:hypothetical protein
MRTTRLDTLALCALLLAGSVGLAQPAPAARPPASQPAAPLSDALKAPRPVGGEWFGIYLVGKKVGHIYADLAQVPGEPDKARAVNEFVFKANVGTRVSERRHREVRTYESKPNGRLLSFVIEQSGDGGDQVMEATNTASGLHLVRRRPGQPDDVRKLPRSPETVEAADLARVALLRNKAVEVSITDGLDLQTYKVSATVEKPQARTINGVEVMLSQVTTLSEKEKVPSLSAFKADGAMVEINLGETMRAVAEPEQTAKRLDKVEVFGLTRVVLPTPLGDDHRQIPGEVRWVVTGLPERFQQNTYRQTFKPLGEGKTLVTLRAAPPSKSKRRKAPLKDPAGGKYLESTLIVEADHPKIRATAKQIAGREKDAYELAKRVNAWVHQNMERDYGASADRASDVLLQMKGDCTEHSLLASALLRSLGIPSRRVDGLVYLVNEDGVPALYWHEWVEAYVGEWTAMDPTFNQVVADATHFALGEEGGAEITPLIGTLKVLEVR